MSDERPHLKNATIGSWADYISLDWEREEDRPLLSQIFPKWVLDDLENKNPKEEK